MKHVLETVSKMLCCSETRWWAVFNVCVSSIAHHKHKTALTFSCIHKVQLFNARTQTAKDSHKKNYKMTTQSTVLEYLNSFLTSQGILCLLWNLIVAGR